ncbi:cysteine proteinase [Rhizophagus clarus]|uniref:ubiquitinyl hydrolase 1 n=1 Tax=Rhizophagus clarus TaxID=94130 RepID=A0A8H3KXD8_9GLOM|nr:cysteine proteinase [Rhizophagus clarus]
MSFIYQSTTEDDLTPLSVTDNETIANRVLPELGQETEDFKHSTWHITNWQNLEERITGPEFEVGGWKWRILLFPFGNNSKNVVSIYLDFVDPLDAPEGWHSCAQFALVMWNPKDPTQYIYHHAFHRFTAKEQDWGFTRFYKLKKLLVPCENRTLAIIENGSANITAFVRVFKDPTGFLWHNFINYDSKKETGYTGLYNQGATGYMNSLLQSLYCIPYFRKAIYNIPTEDEDGPIKGVPLALQRIFCDLQTSNTPVYTTELTKSFGWDSLDTFIHQDVQEFSRLLQDKLEVKMKGTKADGVLTKLFVGKMKSYIKCINVEYESSRVEDYYDIQLNVKGCKTLRDSFLNYIQVETLEGDNKYQAEGYGLQDAKKGIIFESFPPVLHLQLKRFEFDVQRDAMVKINDRFVFPMEIDLEEFLSKDADRSNSHKYLLHGVLVHSGELHEGHYFALTKPEKDGKWFKFDDNYVIPVTDSEVLWNNYGGDVLNANQITQISAVNPTKYKPDWLPFTNAYILIYIRESNIDEILSPVVPEDIPYHLQKHLEEVRALTEQKEKELEQYDLYFNVKVVTAEIFKYYQGFDLTNFDEVQPYKILKSETYGVFKENISQIFNIPSEQIRFWVFVNRQNKTVRPDAPIPESFVNTSMEEIFTNMTSRQSVMKLYMEVADKPINDKTWFPEGGEHEIVFLKYFDPDKQAFEGLGQLYIQKSHKVGDYTRVFCEKKGFPSDTPLELYEEIKPNMIEKMDPISTFEQSEIQDGDIICFQKILTDEEIQKHTTAGRCFDIPQFYESLITVSFKLKLKDRDPKSKFDLVLSKKWTYDMVAKAVAAHLSIDPLKLRFTSMFSTTDVPKSVIKRTTTQTLLEMLQPAYSPPAYVNYGFYYEVLDTSIADLETKNFFQVFWIGNMIKEKEVIDIRLQNNAVISELMKEILKKITLSSPSSRIRLFEVYHNKIQKDYVGNEPIGSIQESATLYAEEVPLDEIVINQFDRMIQVCHFTQDPICLHGIPFKFVIKNGEKFADTKIRLRHRLGMNEKDFSKIKIAIIPGTLYAKPEYFDDEDIILSEKKLLNEDYLGLDYVNKTRYTERVEEM